MPRLPSTPACAHAAKDVEETATSAGDRRERRQSNRHSTHPAGGRQLTTMGSVGTSTVPRRSLQNPAKQKCPRMISLRIVLFLVAVYIWVDQVHPHLQCQVLRPPSMLPKWNCELSQNRSQSATPVGHLRWAVAYHLEKVRQLAQCAALYDLDCSQRRKADHAEDAARRSCLSQIAAPVVVAPSSN